MKYSACTRHFIMLLAVAALNACGPTLDSHHASPNALKSSTFTLNHAAHASFFDGNHMVRSFDPRELKALRINGDRFRLKLFGGISHAFEVTRVKVLEDSGMSWFGRVDDDNLSHFSVTYRDNTAVGSAMIGGLAYAIRTSENGQIELVKLTNYDTVNCQNEHQHRAAKGAL